MIEQLVNVNNMYRLSKTDLPPPRQPSGRVLASSAGGPGFNPQSRTVSYQIRYENGTRSSFVQHSTLKREILALSQELRQENKCNG